jgi:hypothetical protein
MQVTLAFPAFIVAVFNLAIAGSGQITESWGQSPGDGFRSKLTEKDINEFSWTKNLPGGGETSD